jgi:hypothetical protein
MVMKKASGGDSPLRQGVGKSFWTLPISRRRWRWLAVFFMEIDRSFRFSRRGEYIGGKAASECGLGAHTIARRGQGEPALWHGAATSWHPSVSALDSMTLREKLEFWLLCRPIPRIFPV